MSAHTLEYGKRAREFDTTDFQDSSVKRIIKKLSDIERAALNETDLKEVRRKELSFFKYFFETELLWRQKKFHCLTYVGKPQLSVKTTHSKRCVSSNNDQCAYNTEAQNTLDLFNLFRHLLTLIDICSL